MSNSIYTEDEFAKFNKKLITNNIENNEKNNFILELINELNREQNLKIIINKYLYDKYNNRGKILDVIYFVYNGSRIDYIRTKNIKTKINKKELYQNIGKNIKYKVNDNNLDELEKSSIIDNYLDVKVYGKIIGIAQIKVFFNRYSKRYGKKSFDIETWVDYKDIIEVIR